MKSIAIEFYEKPKDIQEVLDEVAKSICENYGAGTLEESVGTWTSIPESWNGLFSIHILIESNDELSKYQMAHLVKLGKVKLIMD